MRHANCWPWRYAYASAVNHAAHTIRKRSRYETRMHRHGGGDFGVRRPLRYLTHALDLDEGQTRRMARVLNQLKTEREQGKVDENRTNAEVARLLESGTPTMDEMRTALAKRVSSAEHMREETAKALVAMSDLLDDDQREMLAGLLVAGELRF